jgi:hypothetical protein
MRLLFATIFLSICQLAEAQSVQLQNPSFEGVPHESSTPPKWQACGYFSTPDILPGLWGVSLAPSNGKSFVGLTARDDNSFEAMGQQLTQPLKANECYSMSIDLARSDAYASYNKPIRLRIWGGNSACERLQLLAVSPTISSSSWHKYTLYFFPKKDYRFVIFEANYANGAKVAYRGNILLDNASAITPCLRADVLDADDNRQKKYF